MPRILRTDRCANPFKTAGHVGRNLRKISEVMLQQFPDLCANSRICAACIKKGSSDKLQNDDVVHESNDSGENICSIESSMRMDVQLENETHEGLNDTRTNREIELEGMLDELKEKFSTLEPNNPLKLQILTIAPSSWSARKIAQEFVTTRYLANKSKELKMKAGILPDSIAREGRKLSQTTLEKVHGFYTSDMNSRIMPASKDVVSVKIDGERTLKQKRLLLMGLKELYTVFKQSHPEHIICFSAFAKLRPKNCILPGACGTHSVCVCTIHQNPKLMLDAIDIQKLTLNTQKPLTNYKDCLNEIVCERPRADCYLDACDDCPGVSQFSEKLYNLLENSFITDIQYSVWTATDRSTLQTEVMKIDDFILELCKKLTILKPHSFISKQQSLFIQERKHNLRDGEVLVTFDFSENYAYICQDASQAFHFNNDQCTVFPAIYYYKEGRDIKHKSYVFLSESLKHDTSAVYAIQTLLIPEIQRNVKKVNKIIYTSDGAKQHFKNKFQIANLVHHKEDFNIDAEWHYSATAHGKGACDGIGATFKREAYRASLTAKPQNAILTPQKLYSWAKGHFETISIMYYDKVFHEKMRRKLNKRFENAQPVPEILKNHGFLIGSDNEVLIKRYSNDEQNRVWWPNGQP